MPVDPSVWADFVSGTTVTAESFRTRFIELQKFINGRILKTDLKSGSVESWVTSDLIFKPEFYGAPAPRVEGVSSDTHYRHRTHNKLDRYFRHEQLGCSVDKVPGVYAGDSDADYSDAKFDPSVWQPVEGMAATVYVDGTSNMNAMCMGTLYAFESGGEVKNLKVPGRDDPLWTAEERTQQGYENQEYLSQVFVEFMLFVDTMDGSGPQARRQTQRRIYPRSGASYNFRKQQVSFVDTLQLTPGVNKVSYRAWYRLKSGGQTSHKHCYVDGRNFIVDLMRL